jgi:uncharacterized membrane protein
MAPEINSPEIIISLAIVSAAVFALALKKIDLQGALVGIALAFIIWLGVGEVVLLGLFAFFVLGTLASSWKKEQKLAMKLFQENEGKRSIRNVLANGGVAGILSFIAFILPEYHFTLFTMAIASFAVACSDTLSAELGNVYGRNYFNIISWKSAPKRSRWRCEHGRNCGWDSWQYFDCCHPNDLSGQLETFCHNSTCWIFGQSCGLDFRSHLSA